MTEKNNKKHQQQQKTNLLLHRQLWVEVKKAADPFGSFLEERWQLKKAWTQFSRDYRALMELPDTIFSRATRLVGMAMAQIEEDFIKSELKLSDLPGLARKYSRQTKLAVKSLFSVAKLKVEASHLYDLSNLVVDESGEIEVELFEEEVASLEKIANSSIVDQIVVITQLQAHRLVSFLNRWGERISRGVVRLLLVATSKVMKRLDPILLTIYAWLDQKSKRLRRGIRLSCRRLLYNNQEGHLSLYFLSKLAAKNLYYAKSRTVVTTGAIALGTGAIVFLVSFAYGLQNIVTNRLVYPNATRLADVQTASTALVLDQKALAEIKEIGGVEEAHPAINAAGTLEYNKSKTDVVVIAAQNQFLEFSNLHPISGTTFSEEANQRYANVNQRIQEMQDLIAKAGDVLGVATAPAQLSVGDLIEDRTIRFRVKDDVYLPVRSAPSTDSQILGYVRGSILESHSAQEVWGGTYKSAGTTGRSYKDEAGQWFGRWLKATVPLYQEKAPTVYSPLGDEEGRQIEREGYLPENEIHILSPHEVMVESQLEKIEAEKEGQVLGETTDQNLIAQLETQEAISTSSATSNLRSMNTTDESTAAAELSDLVKQQQNQTQEEEQLKIELAQVDVAKKGGKEIIVSTGLLDIWQLDPDGIIDQEVSLEYIMSGGIISGLAGKVKSSPVTYKVKGVIDDSRSIVIAPLGDLESMGADRFSTIKVLGKTEEALENVRTHIETLGFTTQSLNDTLSQVNKLFKVMRFLLGMFGLIALIVAVFGMFNTLTVSLLERTREIGVMKTLGTTDTDVLRLFMIESFFIGVLGGILGIVVGVGGGTAVNILFNLFKNGLSVELFRAPLSFLGFIFLLSLFVGVVTGLYPSRRAKGINALDALRYE